MLNGTHTQLLFYETISYTWGTGDQTEEILVDGCRMKVTKSVYEILATLSSQFLPQLLWIDALCIDQENILEKEKQVTMMDKIYSSALFTTVFLGQSCLPEAQNRAEGKIQAYQFDGIRPRDDQTRKHFETARLTFDLFNEFDILREPLRRDGKDVYELYESVSLTAVKPRQWSALLTFLQHPWFARVWIVQEVALSPNVRVHYGDEVIDWSLMANAMRMIHNLRHFRLWLEWSHGVQMRHTDHSSLYNIIRMDNLREKLLPTKKYARREEIGITEILEQSFYFQATNPRDQVYGLISLCADKDSVKVDYEASVESVYLMAATNLVWMKSFGLLFGSAGLGNRAKSGSVSLSLPSWVPDWTDAPKYDHIRLPYGHGNTRQGESQFPHFDVIVIGDRTLLMSATPVDIIADIGPALFDSAGQHQNGSVVDEMCQLRTNYTTCGAFLQYSLLNCYYMFVEPRQRLFDAFNQTIATGNNVDVNKWAQRLEYFRDKPDTNSAATRKETFANVQEMDYDTEKIQSYCGGRRLFVGNKGWIGLCPPGAQKGDSIWSVRGVEVPIMLRKSDGDATGRYMLVGECYCHGLKGNGLSPMMGPEEKIMVV